MANGADDARRTEVEAILKSGPEERDRFLITSIMSLCENGCRKGALHDARLDKLEGKQPRGMDGDGAWSFQWGWLKARAMPAMIIAGAVAFLIIQYGLNESSRQSIKEEVLMIQSNTVAQAEAKAHDATKDFLRELVAIRKEMDK